MNLQVDIWNPVGLGHRAKTLEPRTRRSLHESVEALGFRIVCLGLGLRVQGALSGV